MEYVNDKIGKNKILNGDALTTLRQMPDACVDCCVTSPPYYGLRDYGTAQWIGGDENCKHQIKKHGEDCKTGQKNVAGGTGYGIYLKKCKICGAVRKDEQVGLEKTPEEYIEKLVAIFEEVRRILKPAGTLWLNIGDSYASGKSRYSTPAQSLEGVKRKKEKYGILHDGGRTDFKNHPFIKDKDLIGIPWMLAFALRNAGWYLRADIIWSKPNPMPESVQDRPTKAHEYIFLLTKSPQYYYDYHAILEPSAYDGRKDTFFKGGKKYNGESIYPEEAPQTFLERGHERWPNKIVGRTERKMQGTGYGEDGKGLHGHSGYFDGDGTPRFSTKGGIPARNKRSVWSVTTIPYKEAHFATFPEKLIVDSVKAGCPGNGIVLDPFMGAGTTALVARKLGRNYVGIELNPHYIKIAEKRLFNELGMFA